MTADTVEAPADEGRRPVLQVIAGLGAAIGTVVALVVPVVVMLLLPPRDFPTPLPDTLAVVLMALAGVVVVLVARAARTRPPFALSAGVLMLLLALWFQAETWYAATWVPTPPILPNVPTPLVLVAGVFVAAAVIALTGARQEVAGADTDAHWPVPSVVLGGVAALAVLLVVEGDVWGRGLLQQTFEGPWGLDRFQWLGLLFVGLLLTGVLLGWATASRRHTPVSARVGVALLAVVVALIWIVAGELGGPPRSIIYGLALGALAWAALMTRRPRRPADRTDTDQTA